MTSYEPIPVPVDLGQALAWPGLYLEAPAGLPVAAPAPRVRRPGRMRRRMATVAAVVAAAGLAIAGCGAVHQARQSASQDCHTPAMPSGSTISVDQAGNATAPYTGGLGLRCANGKWVRMTARHDVRHSAVAVGGAR
jgi:hypothetical protein